MIKKLLKTECIDCKYLIKHLDGISCLMKQEFCIVGGKTSYPKDCEYFER